MSVLDYVMGMKSAGAGGGSTGGGGLLVEFTAYDEGQYEKGLESNIPWADIEAAYTFGNSVVFHLPYVESWLWYECYVSLIAYQPDQGNGIRMDFSQDNSNIVGGAFSNPVVAENGKLHLRFYID